MKSPKIGERVTVKGYGQDPQTGKAHWIDKKGVVAELFGANKDCCLVQVYSDFHGVVYEFNISTRDCRRLVKKPRRRVWINEDDLLERKDKFFATREQTFGRNIEFVEVKKK